MLYYERNLITTSGFTLDRERQNIPYGKNDHTASILIDRNRCQNDRISLLIVAGEPTWSQLYPTHAGWIRRLDTSRSGFLHTALPAATAHNGNRFKGNPLELGHLEGDFTGSGNEATATVAPAVSLSHFSNEILLNLNAGDTVSLQMFGIASVATLLPGSAGAALSITRLS